jgi:cell division septum initiation protein DivIVA
MMDEHQIGFASEVYSLLKLQQHELKLLVDENQKLRDRINRLEEMVARVEAKLN